MHFVSANAGTGKTQHTDGRCTLHFRGRRIVWRGRAERPAAAVRSSRSPPLALDQYKLSIVRSLCGAFSLSLSLSLVAVSYYYYYYYYCTNNKRALARLSCTRDVCMSVCTIVARSFARWLACCPTLPHAASRDHRRGPSYPHQRLPSYTTTSLATTAASAQFYTFAVMQFAIMYTPIMSIYIIIITLYYTERLFKFY